MVRLGEREKMNQLTTAGDKDQANKPQGRADVEEDQLNATAYRWV
jgi:hypothetical protein